MRVWLLLFSALLGSSALNAAEPSQPVPLIFDTDIGNDIDDALALGMIHGLQSRGECELLAVTITKDDELAASFVDAVDTFYGRGKIPIGVCDSGITDTPGRYLPLAASRDNKSLRYPHDLRPGDKCPSAVEVLRKTLVAAADHSVVVVQVGFSTNLANLLDSQPDTLSPLSGRELIEKKVRLLSIMAGQFADETGPGGRKQETGEYNIVKDLPSTQKLAALWPTPIVWSGWEVGFSLRYPHQSIERDYDYVKHHPLPEAYILYNPPPHNRPTFDLTGVLYAVRPDHSYFKISPPGHVSVQDDGSTTFESAADGSDRYLIVPDRQKPRILEAMQLLASQPPCQPTATRQAEESDQP